MSEPGSEQSGPSEGPDPWCTWCHFEPPDGELPYRIKGEDDGRWPPAFCSIQCAARWGNAAHQDRIYHVEHGRGLRADGSGEPGCEQEDALRSDLETMVNRWEADAESFDERGWETKATRLKQCIAEVRHFLEKHKPEESDDDQTALPDGGQPSPGEERERVDTEPVTDPTSKSLMLRAERGDKIVVDVMGEAVVTSRANTYYGPNLECDQEFGDRYFRLTAPGPASQLVLWKAVTDEDGFVQAWERIGEVEGELKEAQQYDLCPFCQQPLKTLQHEREAAAGVCNRGDAR